MNINPAAIRSALAVTALMGGGGFLVARYSPIENDYHNGWPKGGPIEPRDWKAAAGVGAFGAFAGVGMGLVGAAIADAPKSMLPEAMIVGSIASAALGVGLVLGASLRD
jgi:hypothetical protein